MRPVYVAMGCNKRREEKVKTKEDERSLKPGPVSGAMDRKREE